MNRGALEPKVYPQMAGKPQEIWKKGKPLNEAWLNFANEEAKAKYDATREPPPVPDITKAEDGWEAAAMTVQAVSQPFQQFQRRKALVESMQSALCVRLLNEELYAYGSPAHTSSDRTPRRIHSEFWENPDINWEKGIANDANSKFQRIRIVDPRDFPEIELKPTIGRKTHKALIYQAIEGILPNCPEFEKLQNKQQIEKVREFIATKNPHLDPYEGKGFGDDAIRKHVKTYLKERNSK